MKGHLARRGAAFVCALAFVLALTLPQTRVHAQQRVDRVAPTQVYEGKNVREDPRDEAASVLCREQVPGSGDGQQRPGDCREPARAIALLRSALARAQGGVKVANPTVCTSPVILNEVKDQWAGRIPVR